MLPLLKNTQQWLAPYAYALVGFLILAVVVHFILRYLQNKNDFLWYRHAISWRWLSLSRKRILKTYPFYTHLTTSYKRQFEHRVARFIADKKFEHRSKLPITDEQKIVLACVAVQLTFGRRHYLLELLDTILLFDGPFESAANQQLHKGEYNPRARVLALSWPDVLQGHQITTDNYHLAIHEFTHVIHIESERVGHIDAMRYHKYHQHILAALTLPELRIKLEQSLFFRTYAFTNQYEFMAVLTEYFFESPVRFKEEFPQLFYYLKKALLYKDE